ncbi:putative mitochondrial hypothetical protein [Leptomonas pyrrhocoris]|uniref:Uncharacterized protein n=1 Tax=Leptomonas pyrrhocoris TaxID=157538 RepID=A0A0N0DZE9_LEPPY|nr:putative mitochondrial hypothetical protein [Leptomonas pyrrhocoris]KPA85205.1 putative mitochondrial hypothetical protein [Leptomonas pyrrhocoris]|eukprot:XP_015663644.1 putative mitochondrial hypothetical protein [Leptomonas pyrrhocoris]
MRGCKVTFSLLRRPLQRATLATSFTVSSSPYCILRDTAGAARTTQRRWQGTTEAAQTTGSVPQSDSTADAQQTNSTADVAHVMERAAEARREIHDLWGHTGAVEEEQQASLTSANPPSTEEANEAEAKVTEARCAAVAALLEKYQLDPTTAREDDVSRGLGDALDRLLLLCVPLSSTHGTDLLLKLMQLCARQGRQLSMRTIQHLFARTNSYAEALAIFYAMRRSNFAMSMEAYHAMLYSLQRLEEEGWAQRFHEEYAASEGQEISEQALDFVLRGVDNQLLPENKPWLGRIMFAEAKDNAAVQRQSRASFDEMDQLWVERYKSGSGAPPA